MRKTGLCLTGLLMLAAVGAQAGSKTPLLGKFRNTYYYVVLEEDHAKDPAETVIQTLKDETIARVSRSFKAALAIEGSGKLLDGRVVNFAGVKNGETRYKVTWNVYGDGVGSCALVPFHTIAVDRSKIPLGSLVLIEETVGMKFPDGSVHDGLWRAEDVGSAIQKDRVDLFVGTAAQGKLLEQNGITHLEALTIRLITPPSEGSCVHHQPE